MGAVMAMAMAMEVGTADAATITDGTEVAVTTNGATIAAGKALAVFAFVIPIALMIRDGSDTNGRALEARPVR
ncbi:hypothetical protein IVB22_23160 [Bradyrhizobium sp. 190]|uniref:hypothetical protein n=1 Tax=Bradyrhizobium sp. 190 TaxID=2782658 RepID=UPI001FF73093|nr:hypothetical protein [Bradyrhizobium sp. 190]MCK1515398.1 hypothetical protein [Bradyrhizobium sp. 190]